MCTIYISHFEQTNNNKYQTQHNAGLALLQYALADYAGICFTENELPHQIAKEDYGKPFLRYHPDIHYNISNCSDMVVCGISNSPLGIDIEKIRPFNDNITRKVLTYEEQSFLQEMNINEYSHQEWFFRFWTLKESFIKHSGRGLSVPLTDFSFSFDVNKDPYEILCSQKDVYFYQKQIEEDFILSLCTSIPTTIPKLVYL